MQDHSTQFKTFITVVYGDVYFLNLKTQIPPSLYAEFKVHGLRLYNWNVCCLLFTVYIYIFRSLLLCRIKVHLLSLDYCRLGCFVFPESKATSRSFLCAESEYMVQDFITGV